MGIETLKYRDTDAIKLSFNNYIVTILNGRGCNIIEFYETTHDLSFLHFPEDHELEEFGISPQRYGSAILFPPNKIVNGCFTKNNTLYDYSPHNIPWSHGILKELPFELVESLDNSESIYVKFRLNSFNTPYYAAFKWKFDLFFEFTLSDAGLLQNVIFKNTGDTPIPFGLGFHTAFRIPFDNSHSSEDYKTYVTCGKQWEMDSRNCPSGNLVSLEHNYATEGIVPLAMPIAEHTTAVYDNLDFIDIELSSFHGAVVLDAKTNTKFIYETDSKFKDWMIWNNNASDNYICIEPMTWIINAPNVPIPDSQSGFQFINPNEIWEAKNKMCVKF